MRNLILTILTIGLLLFLAVGAIAQTPRSVVQLSPYNAGAFVTVFGATSDSVHLSTPLSYKIKVDAPFGLDFLAQIKTTHTTYGRIAYTAKVEESMNDSTYYAIAGLSNITKGTAATDTTIFFNTAYNAGVVTGRFIKITFTPTTGGATIKGYVELSRKDARVY